MKTDTSITSPTSKIATVAHRHQLDELQLADKRKSISHISSFFCALTFFLLSIILTRFTPRQINDFFKYMPFTFNYFLKYVSIFPYSEDPDSLQPDPLIIVFTALLLTMEEGLYYCLMHPRMCFGKSIIDTLAEDLTEAECLEEIKRFKERVINDTLVERIERPLINWLGHPKFCGGSLFSIFILTRLGLTSNAFLKAVTLIIPVLLRSLIFWSMACIDLNKRKEKKKICQPLLDEVNSVLQKIKLINAIKMEFVAETLGDSVNPEMVWAEKFIEGRVFVIHNNAQQKHNHSFGDDFYFYAMLTLNLLLNNFFNICADVLDKDGMIIDIDKAVDSAGDYRNLKKHISSTQKKFGENIKRELQELVSCYDCFEYYKEYMNVVFGQLKSSGKEIEIIYCPRERNAPLNFNTVVPLARSENLDFNQLQKLLTKNGTSKLGKSFTILKDVLYIENCNAVIKSITETAFRTKKNKASKINTMLMASQKDQKQQDTNDIVSSASSSATSSTGATFRYSFDPPSDKPKKIKKPRRLITDEKTLAIDLSQYRNIKLFIPRKQLTIERIEWKHHLPFDSADEKAPLYYPLKNSKGEICNFALLLPMVNEDKDIHKEFNEVLDRGKIIVGHPPGQYIRRLTGNEIDFLKRKKPTLFTAASKIYGEEKLKLLYKLHPANSDARSYGFHLINEEAQVIYDNGANSSRHIGLIVFCVSDYHSHKPGSRSSGIFQAKVDPFLQTESSAPAASFLGGM